MRWALAVVAIAAGYSVATTYISRLPDHRGLFLVPVQDDVHAAPEPPRHTLVIVIDGLRSDGADRLAATRLLAEHGQCFTTDVGTLSVSRPVYAELSTGLEQDRTGSRNNDDTSPLAAISLWELARQAGRTVRGVSELPWWQQLFPRGFDTYDLLTREDSLFARTLHDDITLIHPIYVDETAHSFGGVSPEYTAAVDRVDREVTPLLREIDWQRDLVLFTADHGHRARGGHGAPRPEIEFVRTCLAGKGVTHTPERGVLETRTLAPLLSVLLGVHFPTDMRAGDDTLDTLWPIVASLPADYLSERRLAVDRFRAANQDALTKWGGSWRVRYASGHAWQHLWWMIAGAAAIIALRRRTLWIALALAAAVGAEILFRGSFDVNAVNERTEFARGTLAACALAALASALLHRFCSRAPLRDDQALLILLALATEVAHIAIYGWPLGFPLPEPVPFFLPFFLGIFLVVNGLFLALVEAMVLRRRYS